MRPTQLSSSWASMALFDDDLPNPGAVSRYRPHWLDLHSLPDARLRILQHTSATNLATPLAGYGRPGSTRKV